jgi:hemerythrin
MDKLEKMDWNPHFSVDIDEIDAYQKKMFSLLNDLINLKKNQVDTKEYTNKVSQINDFGKLYFNSEEKLLRKNKYPDFEAHQKAHHQFIRRSISLRKEIAEDVENLSYDVIKELREWLFSHILSHDAKYVPFLRINRFVDEHNIKK